MQKVKIMIINKNYLQKSSAKFCYHYSLFNFKNSWLLVFLMTVKNGKLTISSETIYKESMKNINV